MAAAVRIVVAVEARSGLIELETDTGPQIVKMLPDIAIVRIGNELVVDQVEHLLLKICLRLNIGLIEVAMWRLLKRAQDLLRLVLNGLIDPAGRGLNLK